MALVIKELNDSVAVLTINHCEKLNALSGALIQEIREALMDFKHQHARVIILRAPEGTRIWSAGHDIRELPKGDRDPLSWNDPLRILIREIESYPTPIIAMIDGGVWGGACEVAMACDMVYASPDATFYFTPAKLGVPYNVTGVLNLMTMIDMPILKEMVFTAEPVSAERAYGLGIVNHVVPADQLFDFTMKKAATMAANSPLSISVFKEQLRILADAMPVTTDVFERIQEMRRVVYSSQDYKEGIQAFYEKRKPQFDGC